MLHLTMILLTLNLLWFIGLLLLSILFWRRRATILPHSNNNQH